MNVFSLKGLVVKTLNTGLNKLIEKRGRIEDEIKKMSADISEKYMKDMGENPNDKESFSDDISKLLNLYSERDKTEEEIKAFKIVIGKFK